MTLFSRYKRPISEITGLKARPSAVSMLLRKNAEEMLSMYMEAVRKQRNSMIYGSYYDSFSRTNVTHFFFDGSRLFGAFILSSIVQDLNGMAEKYGLKVRVAIVVPE